MPRKPHPLDPFARSLLLGFMVEHRRRRAKTPYNYRALCDGVWLTIGLRAAPAVRDPAFDLPEPLRTERKSMKRTYRALRDLRGERGTAVKIGPKDVRDRIATEDRDPLASIDTTGHALTDLVELGLVRRSNDLGYLLGPEQPSLPISNQQADPPPPSELVAYASDVATHFGVRQFSDRGFVMPKQKIWVPVEKTDNGFIAVDAETEEIVVVTDEKLDEMKVPTRGSPRRSPAARGELVRVEGRLVRVKLSGREVNIRVLGDWHLRGLKEPEPTTAA